ncbi:MAG: hypothetical protein AAFR32_02265 [Pseudomonadota bacterium]
MTRYTNLREALQRLALPAIKQAEWLDDFFSQLTDGKCAEAFGNEELVMGFGDIALARNHMMEFQELSANEAEIVAEVDSIIGSICDPSDSDFWERKALYEDPRWEQIRAVAKLTLAQLPDERRESDWTRRNWGGGSSKAIPSS